MNITTLVLDIDGTITSEGNLVSKETISLLGKICIQNNLSLIFLTGRAFCLVKYILDEFHQQFGDISFIKGILSELGTKFVNLRGKEVWGDYLTMDTKSIIIDQINHNTLLMFHGENDGYYLYSNNHPTVNLWKQKFSKYGDNIFYIASDDYKFLTNILILDRKVSVIRVSSQVKLDPSLDFKFNPKHKLWEISRAKSKKHGLLTYCDKNNLSLNNILFAGNEPADKSVFELFLGLSIYVGENNLYNVDYNPKDPNELLRLLKQMFLSNKSKAY